MKVEWTPQVKTDTAAEALELSIKKWQFFAYCTWAQYRSHSRYVARGCGLCHRFNNSCTNCLFGRVWLGDMYRCNPVVLRCCDMASPEAKYKFTLTQFHAAARKVYDKLKSLRGKV